MGGRRQEPKAPRRKAVPGRRRWLPVGIFTVGLAAGAAAVAVVWSVSSNASPPAPPAPPQSVQVGSGQVVVLPDRPAELAGAKVAHAIDPVRSAVKAKPLSQMPCLDRVASTYAQAVAVALAAAKPPPVGPVGALPVGHGCSGPVVTGYVVGPDPTGLSQARVSYGNADGDPRHPSGLLDKRSTSVGYGLAAERVKGHVVGYVFGWSVTSS